MARKAQPWRMTPVCGARSLLLLAHASEKRQRQAGSWEGDYRAPSSSPSHPLHPVKFYFQFPDLPKQHHPAEGPSLQTRVSLWGQYHSNPCRRVNIILHDYYYSYCCHGAYYEYVFLLFLRLFAQDHRQYITKSEYELMPI